jgi:hypothetical protein
VTARGGTGLVPADLLAGVQVLRTGGDLQRAGDDRLAPFQQGAERLAFAA